MKSCPTTSHAISPKPKRLWRSMSMGHWILLSSLIQRRHLSIPTRQDHCAKHPRRPGIGRNPMSKDHGCLCSLLEASPTRRSAPCMNSAKPMAEISSLDQPTSSLPDSLSTASATLPEGLLDLRPPSFLPTHHQLLHHRSDQGLHPSHLPDQVLLQTREVGRVLLHLHLTDLLLQTIDQPPVPVGV